MSFNTTISKNLSWFLHSGIMRPNDGFWGVAERIAIITQNEAADAIARAFPCYTQVIPGVNTIEHRRADCTLQTAYMFDLAAEILNEPLYKTLADNLIDFLFTRSALYDTHPDSPTQGLWGWATPLHRNTFWLDDNAWMGSLLVKLAQRGRHELNKPAIDVLRALLRHTQAFFTFVSAHNHTAQYLPPLNNIHGFNLHPHWMGLLTMALSFGKHVDSDYDSDYTHCVDVYHTHVLEGPPPYDELSRSSRYTHLPWSLSAYAYLSLTASVSFALTHLPSAEAAATTASDILLEQQHADGHFSADWHEAPIGAHLTDLIYTQNWATLGLYHAWKTFKNEKYKDAFLRSLTYLAHIQDSSENPVFAGCWRGMFDNNIGEWGGGDCYEGGANSIYSGWTNAPVCWAFLFAESNAALID